MVATRAPSMRGQAFIVFESATFSTAAKRGLTGFSFYGKPLQIDYSSSSAKSKALLRRELGEEAVQEMELEKSKITVSKRGEKRSALHRNGNDDAGDEDGGDDDDDALGSQDDSDDEEEEGGRGRGKRVKLEPNTTESETHEEEEEGCTIQAISIPASIEPEILSALFSRQHGFVSVASESASHQPKSEKDAHVGAEGTWSALIKFQTKDAAQAAKNALHNVQLDPLYSLQLVLL